MQGGTCSPEPGPPRNTGLRPNASSGSQTAMATAAAAADRSAAYQDQAFHQHSSRDCVELVSKRDTASMVRSSELLKSRRGI